MLICGRTIYLRTLLHRCEKPLHSEDQPHDYQLVDQEESSAEDEHRLCRDTDSGLCVNELGHDTMNLVNLGLTLDQVRRLQSLKSELAEGKRHG